MICEKPMILLADDDENVAAVVTRALMDGGYRFMRAATGPETLASAEKNAPDLILLDVQMPGLSGWRVLARLRESAATRTTPVMMLTSCGGIDEKVEGINLGADDYLTKPFSMDELRARVFGLLRRHREARSANPLTGLPGNPSIQAEVERRIAEGLPFGLIHADIDRFKAFNDAYGFARGDKAILSVAQVLLRSVTAAGEKEGFVGHIGGDDFALICSEDRVEHVATMAAASFDVRAARLHDPVDAARGWLESVDRNRQTRRAPLISLSLGGVTTRLRRLDSYAKAASLASEMKGWLKSKREAGPSAAAFDRRVDAPPGSRATM